MIDLHSHILPAVDDGPVDWEDSLAMVACAAAQGTTTLVATPHSHTGWLAAEPPHRQIPSLVNALQERANNAGIEITLLPGQECYYDAALVNELNQHRWLTLGHSRTVLLELPFAMWPPATEQLIYELQLARYTVLLAHPERYKAVQDRPNLLLPLVERGVLMQVTSTAITGRLGTGPERCAKLLVMHGMCHVIASDGHNVRGRPPALADAVARVSEWVGASAAQQMVRDVPEALLKDDVVRPPVELQRVERHKRRRRLFNFFE
ncbi:MAG: hypothetical protein KDD73_11935 [Anaerolineales bacterium]|nr:hypothetical protein [Anaerolineales bacterium]MCB9126294.1 protein-tyrosine-phosphatase [Ardenticatenales bacterium]MCB9171321.1 protein-tyrosine-phosphatase [Ardenticatenales bacterium]